MFTITAGDGMDVATMFIVFLIVFVIAPVLAIFMVIDYRRHLREQTVAPTHCSKCAYDLRASRNQCPECGTQFSTPTEIVEKSVAG